MSDIILILILAIFGIIGYRLMALVDRSIGRHTAGSDQHVREKNADEHAETGDSEHARPGVPFFLNIQR